MSIFRRLVFGVIVVFVAVSSVSAAPVLDGSSGNRLPIVAAGEQRAQIKSIDILGRPHRPLHVYGNAVRRRAGR